MACVGELAAGACDAFATRGLAACLLPGRRGDGDGCASDFQCGSGFCKRTRGINCGSCTPLGRVGSPCAESPECGAGLECAEIGQCVAPAAVGGACNPSQPCRFGAYCGADNLCAAQVDQSGGPCQARGSCAAQRGLVCSQNRCLPFVFARTGQACGGQGILLCEASGDCVLGPGNDGVCSQVARDGEACTAGKSCLAPPNASAGSATSPAAPTPASAIECPLSRAETMEITPS